MAKFNLNQISKESPTRAKEITSQANRKKTKEAEKREKQYKRSKNTDWDSEFSKKPKEIDW